MISEITNIVTATATVFMAWVAWVALSTWRKELIGKNKIELARQIMTSAYNIQDAIMYARTNRFNGEEIKEVEDKLNSEKVRYPEQISIHPDRFQFMIPHNRLAENQEKIDEFTHLMNKACLYWDKEIFSLFCLLRVCITEIREAAKDLYYNNALKKSSDLMSIIYSSGSDDAITKRVNDIVEEFRINLEPIYKDHKTPWKKLK